MGHSRLVHRGFGYEAKRQAEVLTGRVLTI
jgi:hypothetical protein